jgi:ABC-type polar amino acid transport system ATPase subunit
MAYSCKNIFKSYGNRTVLNGVSFDLSPGEIAVLIGPSGVGKSTLLKCATLIDIPEKGEINLVTDKKKTRLLFPSDSDSVSEIYPAVSVVFQQLHLFPHLTLKHNLLLPLNVKSENELSANKKQLFEKYIKKFDLEQHLNKYPNESSIGQRQRIALIRALLLEPEYLFLDEVTSALDVEQVAVLLNEVKELAKQGIGIFIITHLLGFAKRAADKVLFLDNGELHQIEPKELNGNMTIGSERIKGFINMIKEIS